MNSLGRVTVKRIDNNLVQKEIYSDTDLGQSIDFDDDSYQKLSKHHDFLIKLKQIDQISNSHIIFITEYVDGVTLHNYYSNNQISYNEKLSHFNQILHWSAIMFNFSKNNQQMGKLWRPDSNQSLVYSHDDMHFENILITKNGKLKLIDPDAFRWASLSGFYINMIRGLHDGIRQIYPEF